MALNPRYSTIDKAIIVTTGNSLVVCGDTIAPVINTSDMIMLTGEKTRDYTLSGSDSTLNIKEKSTILYAELVWVSTVRSIAPNAVDVRSIQDNPILFTTPLGSNSLSPSYTDSYTSTEGTVERLRAVEVTDIIKNSLSGTYSVSQVPTSIPPTGLSETKSGWSLTVIYKNDAFKPKRVGYTVGFEVATTDSPLQVAVTGFKTEDDESTLIGDLSLVTCNGGPIDGTDIMKAGPSFAQLSILGNPVGTPHSNPGTSPNNPWNSIMSGQINVADPLNSSRGLINIAGTNGSINHDAFVPTQVLNARNKWDISEIDISNTLIPNQTMLAGQYTMIGSASYIEIVSLATQVNSLAPDITATLTAYDSDNDNEYNIQVGEQITYNVQIKNSGKSAANNVILSTVLNPALSFIANSVYVNDVNQPGANITTGFNIGTVDAAGVTNVSFTCRAVSKTTGGTANTVVNYNYSFISGQGSPTYTNYAKTNSMPLIVQEGKLTIQKVVSQTHADINDIITYTINITNVGTETASDILFQDSINKYCAFQPGTVKINDQPYSDYNPTTGFALDDLIVNDIVTVTFDVQVIALSPSTIIENGAIVTFSYIFNQYPVGTRKTVQSNSTSLQIDYIEIIARRLASNNNPVKDETVTYTLTLTNVGNIDALNVLVKEPLVRGASFVAGSVTVNGVPKIDYNPFTGFTLDSIPSQTSTDVTYQVLINEVQPDQIVENIAQVPFSYQLSIDTPIINTEKDSNKVITRNNFVIMDINETVDKAEATLDDILYYSVDLTNNGNINAINTFFLAPIQSGTTFVPNSVAINGLKMSGTGYDPNEGFSVGTIAPGNTVNVTFQSKVTSVPAPNVVYNKAELTYSYKPDPSAPAITDTVFANNVQTIINIAVFTNTKSVNQNYAIFNDYLIYKSILSNTGTVPLTNALFIDEISSYLTFVSGTVHIDGIAYPDYIPTNGFAIGNILPGESVEVVFGVQITTAPPLAYIYNTSKTTYSYKLSQNSPVITKTTYSNQVMTKVVNGSLSVLKMTNKSYATVDDIINYSFEVTNNGNVPVNNVIFFDILPSGLTFVVNSVVVNGISKTSYDPTQGFSLNTINVGQVVSISFNAKVAFVPNPNTATNNATVNYQFKIDPDMPIISKSTTSNNVTTTINTGAMTLLKDVDKKYATINDVLTYTITATNQGTTLLQNIIFTDILAIGATFVAGSVIIDTVPYPAFDPNNGFVVPDIPRDGLAVISFKATVSSIPTSYKIDNTASASYSYKINPSGSSIAKTATSNTVTTTLNTFSVSNTKQVSKVYATVGDTLTYTSVIVNNSTVKLNNTMFQDLIPLYTSFVAGSVTINGTPKPDYNPNDGFTVDTINEKSTVTVVFNVTVTGVPPYTIITNTSNIEYEYKIDPTGSVIYGSQTSNAVTTEIYKGSLTVDKTANRKYAILNDDIIYDIVIINTGNSILKNAQFIDTVEEGSQFKATSVYVNGIQKQTFNPNDGFSLGDINVGDHITVSFAATVTSVPVSGKILNTAKVDTSYYIDPSAPPIAVSQTSNETTVNVSTAILTATKAVDKANAKLTQDLLYTITLYNSGTVATQDLEFKDILDPNIKFNVGSVYVNTINEPSYNPNNGFSLQNIPSQGTTVITFTAKVMTRPSDNIVENFANVDYSYISDPLQPPLSVSTTTNTVTTYVAAGELTVAKAVDKAIASVNDTLNYTINITNTGSVNATDISFKDILQSEAIFNVGSVMINDIPKPTYDPNIGFSIDNLEPYHSAVVTFSVKVGSLPVNSIIINKASVTFSYKLTASDPTDTTTTDSNTVTTNIKLGKINITKAVNKAYATLNDTLIYTVSLENIGNATCSDVFFKDVIQKDALFVVGSVKVNNIQKPSYDPNVGFAIDPISPNATTTVQFSVTVNTLPTDYSLQNAATASYSYIVDPAEPPYTAIVTSPTVSTRINLGKLTVAKSVNKTYVTMDDVISYSVSVANVGNVSATSVNFRDIIPEGLTFVTGSVKINGVDKPTFNPYNSFTLGNLTPGDTSIVVFGAKVTSIPVSSPIVYNTANVIYSYLIDPQGSEYTVQQDSNPAPTYIYLGKLTLSKSVDKAYCTLADTLSYTVVVANTGNVDAKNVLFSDGIVPDASFINGSVTINDISYPDFDPNIGFSLGDIPTLSSVTVKFKVTVNTLPSEYTILNVADATFSYLIDPNGQYYTKTAVSNTVSTIVVVAHMTATKLVDLSYATIDDILNYTINVTNTGNTTNTNVFFKDTLSNGGSFVAGSVFINDVNYPTYQPIDGFTLGDILSGSTKTIKFKVVVTNVPTPPQIVNYATANGYYKIDPQGPDYSVSATSNSVTTQINLGKLTVTKSVDKMYAKVSDTLTYTNNILNAGNITATNVMFFDNLQAELSFIAGTVRINGVINPLLDPTVGFLLGDIIAGQQIQVAFDVKINALPVPPKAVNYSQVQYSYKINPSISTTNTTTTYSNTVSTDVVKGDLTIHKSVDKTLATINDELLYSISITNTGNVLASTVFFQDVLTPEAVFKPGSVIVNGVAKIDFNPITGFALDNIAIGSVVNISFVATVTAVPANSKIINQAVVTFKYVIDPKDNPFSATAYSNTTTTNIVLGNLSVTKAVDKLYATIGETLTYTITIINTGNIDVSNVVFLDPTPLNSVFVIGSVFVNGVNYPSYNPAAGFDLNVMQPGQIITVVYKVTIIQP